MITENASKAPNTIPSLQKHAVVLKISGENFKGFYTKQP